MKRILSMLLAVTILLGCFPITASAAGADSSAVTRVYFTTEDSTEVDSATLKVTPSIDSASITFSKESITIQVMAQLEDGSVVNVSSLATCAFTDGLVATTTDLDDRFTIQAVESGSAGFTAAYGGQSAKLPITVPVYLKSLTLSASKFIVFKDNTMQAQVIGNYSDGTQAFLTDDYEFSCADGSESLIDVTAEGAVTGKAKGTAYVTATEKAGSNTITSLIYVYEVKSFTAPAVSVAVGERAELLVSATIDAIGAVTLDVLSKASYISADPSIAEVNQAGEVKGTGIGTTNVTVTYMGATVDVPVTVGGTAYISETSASYNKNETTEAHADILLSVTNAATLEGIMNGSDLVLGSDYMVAGHVVTIATSYLDTLAAETQSLTFNFNGGGTATLAVNVTDTPDSTVSTDRAVFDQNKAGGDYTDLVFTMNNLNGNTLKDIGYGYTALVLGTDYTVSGSTVTINKSYLNTIGLDYNSSAIVTLTFVFNQGANYSCQIGIVNSSIVPLRLAKDSDGNQYYFNTGYVVEVPAKDGTQRGRYMTAGKPYIVAGIGGTQEAGSGNNISAVTGTIDSVRGVSVDPDGNLYICGLYSLYEVAAEDGTQWGIDMKTGYLYNLYTASQNLTNKYLTQNIQVTPIVTDSEGNVYFFTFAGSKINVMVAKGGTRFGIEMKAGETYTIAGGYASSAYTTDGTRATDLGMSIINGLALDQAGNMYFTQENDNRVHMMPKDNEVHFDRAMKEGCLYLLAGNNPPKGPYETAYGGDGEKAVTAKVNQPNYIAVDKTGNVYFYDSGNHLIRVIATSTSLNGVPMTPGNIYSVFKHTTITINTLQIMDDGDIWYHTNQDLTPVYTDTANHPISGNADLASVQGVSVACSGSSDSAKPRKIGNFILGDSNSAITAADIVPADSNAKLTMYSSYPTNTTTGFGSGTYRFTITAQDGRISYYRMTITHSEDTPDSLNQDGTGNYLHNYKADQLYRVFGQTRLSTTNKSFRIGTGTDTDPHVENIWVDASISRVETTDLELFHDNTAQLYFCGTDSTFTNITTEGVNLEPGETTTVYFYIIANDITEHYYYKLNIIKAAPVANSAVYLKTLFNRPVYFGTFVPPSAVTGTSDPAYTDVYAGIYVDSSVTSISADDIGIADNMELYIDGIASQSDSIVFSDDGITQVNFLIGDDDSNRHYHLVIIQKSKLLSAEAGISTVLGKTAAVDTGNGSGASPMQVTVAADNSVTAVGASDIIPTDSNLATVHFYGTDNTFATTTADNTTLTAGENKVYAAVEAQDGAILYYAITVNHTAVPTITTTTLPGGTISTAYSQTLAVTGTTPITWSLDSGSLPDSLTLATDTGIISGTPTTAGTYTFTVKATNSLGDNTKILSIVISAINHLPGPKDTVPTQSMAVGGSTSFIASDIAEDEDTGDTLAVTAIVTGPDSETATASLESGTVTVLGVSEGSTSMKVTVSDGNGGTVNVTVPITVTAAAPSNHAPTAKTTIPSQSMTVSSNASFTAVDIAEDTDSGDTLTVTGIVTEPDSTYATASLTSETVTITSVAAGSTSIVVTVSDGNGGTVDVTVPITVTAATPSNHAPTAKATISAQSITVGSDTSFIAADIAEDTDSGDILTVTGIVTEPNSTYATASLTSGTVTITGVATGSTSIAVTVSDGNGGTIDVTVPIEVTAVAPSNHAPTAKTTIPSQSMTVGSNESFIAGDIAEDTDSGDTLTVTGIVTAPNSTYATASLTSGTVTITGVAAGSTSMVVTVSDGNGGTVNVTVPIEVTAIPDVEISISQSPIKTILHAITFGLFFDETVDVSIESEDSTVDHYEYQIVADGDTFDENSTWTQNESFSIDPDFKGRVYARDVYDGGSTSEYTIKALVVDKTKPTISANYKASSGSIEVSVTDDGAGIETITYQVGSGTEQTIDLEPSETQDITTQHDFTIKNLPDGQYDVVINATDNSGNAADTETIEVDRNVITDAVISPTSATYDLSAPDNVSTTITWNSAATVTDVVYNSVSLPTPDAYVVTGSALTIKSDYIETLGLSDGDMAEFEISFDVGSPITFTVDIDNNPTLSDNADLKSLTVNGDKVSGFDPDKTEYDVELPYGTESGSAAARVEATTADPLATKIVSQAAQLPGDATVTVTSEDTNTKQTYTIHFSLAAPTDTIVNIAATQGVPAPVRGAYPVTNITETAQYTGNVAWNPANNPFGASTVYTATITLTPKTGYTLMGVGANFFTVSGASSVSNSANSGVITATFPATEAVQNNNGGSGSGGSTPSAPVTHTPEYSADVSSGSTTVNTLPVIVNTDTGSAAIDVISQSNLMSDGEKSVITVPSIPGVDTYTMGIPVPDLSTPDKEGTLTVNTDTGSITVSSNMLTGVTGTDGTKAEISIGQGDKSSLPEAAKAAIGDRPLIQLSVSIDGKLIAWNNPDVPVTVSIPYTPTASELENPDSIIIWYVDGSGKMASIPNGHYNQTTGTVTFATTHFSYYAVGFNKVSFTDIAASAWYSKAVGFIAARGITTGTGNGSYSPEAKLTRGEFLVMLMKAYGIAPDTDLSGNFSDAGNMYYTGYLAAAKRLGISGGVGNNMFAPGNEITRQEMFTLLYNALKVIGELPQGDDRKPLSSFSDAGQIDSWAKDAMKLLVETGTIGGNAGKLTPTSTTTRAEMAQVLYNLMSE